MLQETRRGVAWFARSQNWAWRKPKRNVVAAKSHRRTCRAQNLHVNSCIAVVADGVRFKTSNTQRMKPSAVSSVVAQALEVL